MVISLLLLLLSIFDYNVDTMSHEKVQEREEEGGGGWGRVEKKEIFSLLALPLSFSAFPTLTLMNE